MTFKEHTTRARGLWGVLLVALFSVLGCRASDPVAIGSADDPLSVLTWNVYVGTDVTRIRDATS